MGLCVKPKPRNFENMAPNTETLGIKEVFSQIPKFCRKFSIVPNRFSTQQSPHFAISASPMSSSTIFIALQCCQCSTMQVKQKKRSSNKWSCAVCNQKQSVQKVFAQGFMAKDLRKFVQDFNMSRKLVDDGRWHLAGTLDPASSECQDGEPELPVNSLKKKRIDWTAYLDQEEDHHIIKGAEQEKDGDDHELLVVTELHKGMLKKRRSEENSSGFGGGGSAKLFKKPVFPNSQEVPMPGQRRLQLTESNSEKCCIPLDNRKTQNCKPTTRREASKWNDYVIEDNDNFELGWKRATNFEDDSVPCSNNLLEATTNEQRVEDDIHPDFM